MKKLILFFLIIIPLKSFAQDISLDNSNLLKVEGDCIVKSIPENMKVYLTIKESDDNYQACLLKALDTRSKIVHTFEVNGISKNVIEFLELSVKESYSWKENNEPKYRANINLLIENKYSVEFAMKIVKSVTQSEFAIELGITFSLSEQQKENMREKAISEAVKDAFKKAELIAKTSNVLLDRVYSITYGKEYSYNYGNSIDNDIIKVEEHNYLPITIPKPPSSDLDYNPKAISIMKSVFIEWKLKL